MLDDYFFLSSTIEFNTNSTDKDNNGVGEIQAEWWVRSFEDHGPVED